MKALRLLTGGLINATGLAVLAHQLITWVH